MNARTDEHEHDAATPAGGVVADVMLPMLAAIAGLVPFVVEASLPRAAAGLAMLACLCLLGWRLKTVRERLHATPELGAGAPQGAASRSSELQDLLAGVLPIWLCHVDCVHEQTRVAVDQLARSFSKINEQFESAGFQGSIDPERDEANARLNLLVLCERQLQPVVSSMTSILEGKAALVDSVNDLASATGELRDMASAVTRIAAQTNLLALNAAIEAARVGAAGRGFAVIAKEIRELSQVSATTGKQITDRIARVSTVMSATVAAATQTATNDKTVIDLSSSVVEDVLTHVRAMSSDSDRMRGQGNVIRGEVERLLVSLQFQDRVSQILSVVDADMQRLQHALSAPDRMPDAQAWLAELQGRYTMDEQRQPASRPGRARTTTHSPAVAAPTTEVTFF